MELYYIVSGWVCIVYLLFGIYAYKADTRNRLNQLFMLLSVDLTLAAVCNSMMEFTRGIEQYAYWYGLSVLFWGLYTGLIVNILLLLAKREKLLSKKWIYAALYLPAFLVLASEIFLLKPLEKDHRLLYTFVLVLEYLYMFGFPLAGMLNIWFWGRKSSYLREKKQARIIVIVVVFAIILSLSETILINILDIHALPDMTHIFSVVFVMALWYAIGKYRIINIRSLVSAEDIISKVNDLIFIIDERDIITGINSKCEAALGFEYNNIVNMHISSFIRSWGEAAAQVEIAACVEGEEKPFYDCVTNTGGTIPVNVQISKINDKAGDYVGSIVVCSDITIVRALCNEINERKEKEDRLNYLNLHDTLTGLYNRRCFEQELVKFKVDKNKSIGIVICDIDGLKFVNDTMGHDIGDKLLVSCAKIISEAFEENESIFRIDGDEFAVLMPDADNLAIKNAGKRISEAVGRSNSINQGYFMSISIGSSINSDVEKDIVEVLKEADNNMYREKLNHIKSKGNSMLQGLLKLLEARDFVTEGHEERMKGLVVKLGADMGFPENKITDLRLLAQFHDIGKVGITDRILFKPGPLDAEEMKEMKRHSEIGYRISKSIPELSSVAELILKHHERWDGKGYPMGLGKNEIPMECRILSIVDAFDAMTHDRPYRKAMSSLMAVEELERNTGTQFDPQLVPRFVEMLKSSHAVDMY